MTELTYLIMTLVMIVTCMVLYGLGYAAGFKSASTVYDTCGTCGSMIRWHSFYWAHIVPQVGVDHTAAPKTHLKEKTS